jgi:hypothetical protein
VRLRLLRCGEDVLTTCTTTPDMSLTRQEAADFAAHIGSIAKLRLQQVARIEPSGGAARIVLLFSEGANFGVRRHV